MCGQIEQHMTKTEGPSCLAVFVSGSGSNLQVLIEATKNHEIQGQIQLVVSDNAACYALTRAKEAGIETLVLPRKELRAMDQAQRDAVYEGLVEKLQAVNIDWVILAGYLSVVPKQMVSAFKKRIVNLHPSLIPKYCGKGFYGMKVHTSVIEAKDVQSGITIHYVDEGIDTGEIIFQATCPVAPTDTPEQLADKIHTLEHQHFKRVIGELIQHSKS